MNVLKVPYYAELDIKLEELWLDAPGAWCDFLYTLDDHITNVYVEEIKLNDGRAISPESATYIEFVKEEHISWFLMKWA